MTKTILGYAAILAVGVFALEWLEYRYIARAFPVSLYLGLVAVGFAAIGVWAGMKLAPGARAEPFERNQAAVTSLSLTPRELDVLDALSSGLANKEIARQLGTSPNTVKTQIAKIYAKLEVSGRVYAINKARDLSIVR
jgi:DNA-binding CsgD family transcriptional regulator